MRSFPDFEAYLQDLLRRSRRSLYEIENKVTEEAVDRCRELARKINSVLLEKKINRRIDVSSLADFQVSLERAASVLSDVFSASGMVGPGFPSPAAGCWHPIGYSVGRADGLEAL